MKSRLPLLLLGVSTLAACAGIPKPEVASAPLATQADRYQPTAEAAVQRLEIAVAPGQTQLGANERAQLASFANDYLRYGHGPLALETPSGGGNSDSASVLAADARRALADSGVSYAAIAGSTRDAGGEMLPILVSFNRFEAQAPDCAPLYEQDLAHQSNNQPWSSFGCATNFNLAAMVEDPADLVRPRDAAARDSERRDTVMDAYRAGEQTHAERSSDERVAISNAVQ
ncbi:MAG: CpaD family pilus assembly protein [Alphaproteobacteria bacterium]|nr:CpaD family pilus assembly protein [Alphaproteobacteria bacterium]